jgi:hypothetical protein
MEGSMMKGVTSSVAVAAALLVSGAASAQQPAENVGKRHPNMAAAQHLSEQAFQKIADAQRANEFDMGGHAQKAKELLDEANKELREAATAANK